MKIIVTGCRGQLGTEIIKQLREGRSELGPIPEKLVSATVIPVDLPELDITNYKMVDDFIRRQRPDVIINCAAFTNVDGCEAADFVRMIEKRQGIKISAPEEIAFKYGWIDRDTLLESAERYGKSPYGQHLKNVADGKLKY